MNFPKLTDLNVSGKRVLVRADLDVEISETYRLEALLPTLEYLSFKTSKIYLIGHRGRPEGKVVDELKMKPVEDELRKITGGIGFEILENLRFDPRELSADLEYAKSLASLADVFVNESFAESHRNAASIVLLPKLLPHAAGLRFVQEVENLSRVFDPSASSGQANPKRPVVVIVGGLKKDKLDYINSLKKTADKILVGGRLPEYIKEMSNDKSQMLNVLDTSVRLQRSQQIIVADLIQDKEDITLNSIDAFEDEIKKAGTIVLAGPMGKYEEEGHWQGTERIFKAVAANKNAFKIAGGGDTIQAVNSLSLSEGFDWISVGGGAMLEFLTKRTLPGIEALESE